MAESIRVVHYINQFFAGKGGEEAAGVGVSVNEGALGSARALQQVLGSSATVVQTIVCGDNFFNERSAEALAAIERYLIAAKAQVLVAGPAFGSGRYGLACAHVCRKARDLGLPALSGMHEQNPGALAYRSEVIIVPTGETAAGMAQALARIAPLALKLARGEKLAPASVDGYLPQGRRVSIDRKVPGYQRALTMLLDKMQGRAFSTEVPIQMPDRVAPAKPVASVARARLGLVTTGGLVRKGNPERAVSRMATRFHRHRVAELESLSGSDWEAFHSGYFNHIVNTNPNYILPLSFLRDLEKRGMVGNIFEWIYALPGVGTSVASSRLLGRDIARDLADGKVDAALLVSTWGTCNRSGATIAKEIERTGIPVAMISAIYELPLNTGANRVVRGARIEHVIGDPNLGAEKDYEYGMRIVRAALRALETEVSAPTLFSPLEMRFEDLPAAQEVHRAT